MPSHCNGEITGPFIDMVAITIGSNIGKMTAMGQRYQREIQIMNPGETLILTRDCDSDDDEEVDSKRLQEVILSGVL
ncbi:hypothetical protein LOK49_LG12G02754 [Camellia lanceoleosa]|uniref:Uncharacterized protein n=1 Tax=Camellia lanceoleosa TaxID=1840588 RepID=A0ACC0FUM0_9ERIC|nr:hypothetical protein LOK49_LG12G02754 [Camellia lanceoleosa]